MQKEIPWFSVVIDCKHDQSYITTMHTQEVVSFVCEFLCEKSLLIPEWKGHSWVIKSGKPGFLWIRNVPAIAAPFPPPSMSSVASLGGQKQAVVWVPGVTYADLLSLCVCRCTGSCRGCLSSSGQAGVPGFPSVTGCRASGNLKDRCRLRELLVPFKFELIVIMEREIRWDTVVM